MGKNYYCEFCERSFADILSIRKKHIQSTQHQRMRKLHYDSYKDAASILNEESQKNPCNRFFQTGHCDFGEHCRFSHKDVSFLQQQVEQEREKTKQINWDEIEKWLEKWKKKFQPKDQLLETYHLPLGFPSPNQLPPSLQPPIESINLQRVDWGQ